MDTEDGGEAWDKTAAPINSLHRIGYRSHFYLGQSNEVLQIYFVD